VSIQEHEMLLLIRLRSAIIALVVVDDARL